MRIASQCQERALLLLQIAQECPQFREQAVYLAHEWLDAAALWTSFLDLIERVEQNDRPN
jgi:hypothetical protein